MFLVNKSFMYESDMIMESKNLSAISVVLQYGYEKVFIPIYDSYEDAVKDFPHENIIELKE